MVGVGFRGKELCTMKLFKDPKLFDLFHLHYLKALHWIPYIQPADDGREKACGQCYRRFCGSGMEIRTSPLPHFTGQNSVFDFKVEGLQSFILVNK